jgi:hypothetical protein
MLDAAASAWFQFSSIGCASFAWQTEGLMTTDKALHFLLGGKMLVACGAILSIAAVAAPFAQAAQMLPYYDPMDWPEGERVGLAGSSGIEWEAGNSTGTGRAEFRAPSALTYPGLSPAPSGKGILSTGVPGSGRDRGILFPLHTFSATDPTMYASFLLNVDQGPAGSNKTLAGFRNTGTSGGFTPRLGLFVTPNLELALSKNSQSAAPGTTDPLSLDTTYLIVVRYEWLVGDDNDELSLWVNPSGLGVAEPLVPDATLSLAGLGDAATFESFMFTLRNSGGGGTYHLDELRIGETWADVTPVPEPSSIALLSLAALLGAVRRRR